MGRFYGPEYRFQDPGVVFKPDSHSGFQRGINQMLNLIKPTLGPYPRLVASEEMSSNKNQPPEVLDYGALIARRVIEIPGADADMGSLYIRQMLWRMHEMVGDGTATAAVLFQAIYNEGLRYIAAGGNPMMMRKHLEKGRDLILAKLDKMTSHISGKEVLSQIAKSVCYDPPLAEMMGEIFDIIGEYGRLEFRTGRGRKLEREYFEGMYWAGSLASRQMVHDFAQVRTNLEDASILITNLDIKDPGPLLPILMGAVNEGIKSMLVVAGDYSDLTTTFLTRKEIQEKLQVVAVKLKEGQPANIVASLEDMAIFTGGRPILREFGQTLQYVKPEDLGQARSVWAEKEYFGMSRGKGDARKLRQHIAALRSAYHRSDGENEKDKALERIGKLMGGSVTLWLGATTETEIEARKDLAQRTSLALRNAVREGVLPGAGSALLACRPMLQAQLDQSNGPDERAAYRILLRAIEEPLRTLAENAGYEPSHVMSQLNQAKRCQGFDLHSGQVVNTAEAGIFDVASAQKMAVHSAISSAALALTIDVLVHRREIVVSQKP